MNDILTVEIDDRVQAVLAQKEGDHHGRARAAAALIEEHVRHEADVWDVPLGIPLEWQHRVPISSVHTEPATINYFAEVRDEEGYALARTAFSAEFDGDEDLAEAAFEAFWEKDRS